MALMAQDKKVKRGRLTFILLEAIGRAVIRSDVEPVVVRDFLARKLARASPDALTCALIWGTALAGDS